MAKSAHSCGMCIADCILSGAFAARSGGEWDDDYPAASCADAAAGSVLLRGLLFSNPQPVRSQWRPMRGAVWNAAQRGMRQNLMSLQDHLPGYAIRTCSPVHQDMLNHC